MSNNGYLCRDGIFGNLRIKNRLVLDSKANLNVRNTTIHGFANVQSSLNVFENATFHSNATISGNLNVSGELTVLQDITFTSVKILEDANICGNLTVLQNTTLKSDANVCGNLNVSGELTVLQDTTFKSDANVCGSMKIVEDANICGNLTVSQDTTLKSDANICGNVNVSGELTVLQDTTLKSDANVCGSVKILEDANICGNLTVNKDIVVTGNITSSGTITANNIVITGNTATGVFGNAFNVARITVDGGHIVEAANVEIDTMFVSAKKYGVVGDGVTDDTAALQAAIDGEINLYIPEGNYRITSTLVIGTGKDGFIMRGQGKGNGISAMAPTSFLWDGAANGTMMRVFSVANVDLGHFLLIGRNNASTLTHPGIGLEVTGINAMGSMHFSSFHDIDITYVDGVSGVGLQVGSATNDDVSNLQFKRFNITVCNVCILQIGSQTINAFYNDSVFLEFYEKGAHFLDGNIHLNNNGFYGGSTAKEDIICEPECEEFVCDENYHEIINSRTGSKAFSFPAGARKNPTQINGTRIITIVGDSPVLIDYQQQGGLSITNSVIGTLNSGTISLINNSTDSPQSLSLEGTSFGQNWPVIIQGNWNYQSSIFLQERSFPTSPLHIPDTSNATAIFDTPFNLADSTTYDVDGFFQIARIAGTNAHVLEFCSNGSASFIAKEMNFVVRQSTLNWETPIAPIMSAWVGTTNSVLTQSNSTSLELISITAKGQLRTDVGGGGTFVPEFKYNAAPGGETFIKAGSHMNIKAIGPATLSNVNPVAITYF